MIVQDLDLLLFVAPTARLRFFLNVCMAVFDQLPGVTFSDVNTNIVCSMSRLPTVPSRPVTLSLDFVIRHPSAWDILFREVILFDHFPGAFFGDDAVYCVVQIANQVESWTSAFRYFDVQLVLVIFVTRETRNLVAVDVVLSCVS